MKEPGLEQIVHEIKSPLTLLGVFLSALNELEDPEEAFSFAKKFMAPCKKALAEIEKAIGVIAESTGIRDEHPRD